MDTAVGAPPLLIATDCPICAWLVRHTAISEDEQIDASFVVNKESFADSFSSRGVWFGRSPTERLRAEIDDLFRESLLSLVWAVLDRVSRGWRGDDICGAGCRTYGAIDRVR